MNIPPSVPDRRRVLLWGGVTVFAATLAILFGRREKTPRHPDVPENVPATPTTDRPVTMAPAEPVEITHEGIRGLINTEFTLERTDEPGITGTLIEVTPERRIHAPNAEYRVFSLLFAATVAFPKDGAICRISHPQLVPSEVFLAPVGRPSEGRTLLEAAFSLRV